MDISFSPSSCLTEDSRQVDGEHGNVPTPDIHMNQVDSEKQQLLNLRQEHNSTRPDEKEISLDDPLLADGPGNVPSLDIHMNQADSEQQRLLNLLQGHCSTRPDQKETSHVSFSDVPTPSDYDLITGTEPEEKKTDNFDVFSHSEVPIRDEFISCGEHCKEKHMLVKPDNWEFHKLILDGVCSPVEEKYGDHSYIKTKEDGSISKAKDIINTNFSSSVPPPETSSEEQNFTNTADPWHNKSEEDEGKSEDDSDSEEDDSDSEEDGRESEEDDSESEEDESESEAENVMNSISPSQTSSVSPPETSSEHEIAVDDDTEEYFPPGVARNMKTRSRITRPRRMINKTQIRHAKSENAAMKRRSCTRIPNKHLSKYSEEDTENSARVLHNKNERNRRAHLKQHFHTLWKLIPDQQGKETRLKTLNGAIDLIQRFAKKRPLRESNDGVDVAISGGNFPRAEASNNINRCQKFSESHSEEIINKRKHRNELEHRRRQRLKTAFKRLAAVIPVLKDEPNASKRNILIRAAALIKKNAKL